MKGRVIYTVGSSNRTLNEFLELLDLYQIEVLVDVRRFPTSKFEHFKKENLSQTLLERTIDYLYLGKELGGFRPGGYKEYMKEEGFRAGIEKLEELGSAKKVVVMCIERFPWRCHRRYIAQALEARDWEILHLIEKERVWMPKRKDVKLKVVYRAPDEVSAMVIKGLLEKEGVPHMLRSLQVPGYDDVLKVATGVWGEILVPEREAERGGEIIREYLESLEEKEEG